MRLGLRPDAQGGRQFDNMNVVMEEGFKTNAAS